MMLFQLAIITVATLMGLASATPFTRQSFTTLTPQQVSSYSPYTYYAAAAKCTVGAVRTWTCGGANLARPFLPLGRKCRYNTRRVGPEASISFCSELPGKSQFQALCRWRRWKCGTVLYERSPNHEVRFHGCLRVDMVYRVCGLRPRPKHSHCGARADRFDTDVGRSKSFG